MNIEQQEKDAAETVIGLAKYEALGYSKLEDSDAATVALLWAAFEIEAKRFGLTKWRGVELE